MEKKLYRSSTDRMFCGVCAGIGEYFGIDPTIIRLLAVFLGFSSGGMALLAYFAAAVIVPQEPKTPY